MRRDTASRSLLVCMLLCEIGLAKQSSTEAPERSTNGGANAVASPETVTPVDQNKGEGAGELTQKPEPESPEVRTAPSSAAESPPELKEDHGAQRYAEDLYKKAQRLFLQEKCDAALPIFEQSFALWESPNSKLYVARCLEKNGQYVRAFGEYLAVVLLVSEATEPEQYAQTQLAATKERSRLRLKLGRIGVSLPANLHVSEVVLGGQVFTQEKRHRYYWVNPGKLEFLIRPGKSPSTEPRILKVAAGQTTEVLLLPSTALQPGPAQVDPLHYDPTLRAWAWATTAGAVVGLSTGGYLRWRAQQRYDRIQPDCKAGTYCDAKQVARGMFETELGNSALLAGAGLGLTATVLWWFSSSPVKPKAVAVSSRGVFLTVGGHL